MSGIVGILNRDGAPVCPDLLNRMTSFLRFRGPDAQNCWSDFNVGFGHALLDTSGGRSPDKQPRNIDGKFWIVADARIDARAELCEKLRSSGITVPPGITDSELILLSYQAWAGECVHHLLGDFAFAIWDKSCQQLFCARDHFGIKPFFYANLSHSFIFSNTLRSVRLHPDVSCRLNDLAIADYLLFGGNQDPSTTSFEEIRRLPPAHSLFVSEGKLTLSRYWMLPQREELRYKSGPQYVEGFLTLFQTAVRDRLPEGPVAVSMSGGLDSSSVAAVAGSLLGGENKSRIRAYTGVYDRLIPDHERHFAGTAARFLGIPIQYFVGDDHQLFQHWQDTDGGLPEPSDEPLFSLNRDLYRHIAAYSRVVLTGEGGDPCLLPSAAEIVNLLTTGKLWKLAAGYARCAVWQRMVPRVGLRTILRARPNTVDQTTIPKWISPELCSKLDLAQRATKLESEFLRIQHHRPEAFKNLSQSAWANHFEAYDPGNLSVPVESRHPFFDVRVVEFLLRLPTLPWCVGKQILREAMAEFLPPEVLRRKKTALAGDPLREILRQPESLWIDSFQATSEVLRYVNPAQIPVLANKPTSGDVWRDLRPLTLDHWLRTQVMVGYKGRS